jgi:hypothetical protein
MNGVFLKKKMQKQKKNGIQRSSARHRIEERYDGDLQLLAKSEVPKPLIKEKI